MSAADQFEFLGAWRGELHLDNGFADIGQRQPADLEVPAAAHHDLDDTIGGGTEPAGQIGAVIQRDLDAAAPGPTEVLFGRQRPVHARRTDFQRVGGLAGVNGVKQRRGAAGQLGDRLEVQRGVPSAITRMRGGLACTSNSTSSIS